MEDFLGIIVFLVFFLLSAVAGARKKKRQQRGGQPQPRLPTGPREETRPAPRPEYTRPRGTTAGTPEERAAELVPAELWEILTGQKLPPTRAPAPPPEPEFPPHGALPRGGPEFEPEWLPDEAAGDEEAELPPWRRVEEVRAAEDTTPRPHPIIVSLEEEIPRPAARHAAFHARVDRKPAAPSPRAVSPARALGLTTRAGLRRAVLLREVLGPPKALE